MYSAFQPAIPIIVPTTLQNRAPSHSIDELHISATPAARHGGKNGGL